MPLAASNLFPFCSCYNSRSGIEIIDIFVFCRNNNLSRSIHKTMEVTVLVMERCQSFMKRFIVNSISQGPILGEAIVCYEGK